MSLLRLLVSFKQVFLLPSPMTCALMCLIVATPRNRQHVVTRALGIMFYLTNCVTRRDQVVQVNNADGRRILPCRGTTPVNFLGRHIIFVSATTPRAGRIRVK